MSTSEEAFPVVGIGASAGGLAALEKLFRPMPRDIGMGFVIVTHLRRGHESSLAEILARYTELPVSTATHDAKVEPNHVYVCPPDQVLTMLKGRLQLTERELGVQRKPIDVFLSSLALDCEERAVGIVLSGSGNDGALGMKAVKERGGLTLAQGSDDSVPDYPDMPDAAIASGVVDLALPAEKMALHLSRLAKTLTHAQQDLPADGHDAYREIHKLLFNQAGHDFSGYKERTFHRRVHRRMQIVQSADIEAYVAQLRENRDEVNLLFRDLLIGVTNFFRDPEAFQALEHVVIPKLFEGKGPNDSVRVWVPGCATGEEIYSIAILLCEYADKVKPAPKIQLFATDIDDAALSVARGARYPAPLLGNVSPERLKRFFVSDDVTCTVSKAIRDLCVFSSHSVLRDPPFSRMDLISCRNLLIYLGAEFQGHVLPVLHFALKPGAYLFLGTSENVGQHSDLFTPIDKKQRIFQRRDHLASPVRIPAFTAPVLRPSRGEPARPHHDGAGPMAPDTRRAVEQRVLEGHGPPHVVVDRDAQIIHYSPRTGQYLEPAAGLPNRQLFAMARRGLRLELRAALHEAIEARRPVRRKNVPLEMDDRVQLIDIVVEPLGGDDPLFLVLFKDVGEAVSTAEMSASFDTVSGERSERLDRLEQELRDTRERLQSTVEEYETAVEELKSSNEELQSVNEEMQSTNEEMETSKEELQSLNEELHTVNAELNSKVDEVDRANADLRNIFDSTQIATVFLDDKLIIRSFTPAVTQIFNLIPSDRGRPLTDIVSRLEANDLGRDIRSVIARGHTIERNVRRADGKADYLMRILPYLTHTETAKGVLVTFVDVTMMVESEKHQRTLVEELNHRVRNMLTVVNAIASSTLRKSTSPETFADAFTGRIQAMGDSFSLVSRENWNEVSLREIVSTQLKPFDSGRPRRLHVEGPAVMLKPSAALGMGLVIHELATNAAKHGALSNGTGEIALTWHLHNSPITLVIEWRERGGPPAKPPTKKGFGSELIERELASTLKAVTTFDYAATGFVATIRIPVEGTLVSVVGG